MSCNELSMLTATMAATCDAIERFSETSKDIRNAAPQRTVRPKKFGTFHGKVASVDTTHKVCRCGRPLYSRNECRLGDCIKCHNRNVNHWLR